MNKWSVNINNLKESVLFECIIQKSAVAQKNSIPDFYTYQGKPKDYMKTVISDIRGARKVIYKERVFYIVNGSTGIAYIFFDDNVYSFDEYYQDCPIFASILEN